MRTFKDFTEELKLKMIDKSKIPLSFIQDNKAMTYFIRKRQKERGTIKPMSEL